MKSKLVRIFSAISLALLVLIGVYNQQLIQLFHTIRLFNSDVIVHNFSHIPDLVQTKVIKPTGPVNTFDHSPKALPATFDYYGDSKNTQDWLTATNTTALLVVKGNDITFEQYYQGTGEFDHRISWSMAKSFLSALFGIAVEDGLIPDLNVPVTDYVPQLIGSGYEGVSIKNVLQMSSGIYFNEDYGDFFSDINRLGRIMALGGSFDDFAASLTSHKTPGTEMHYVSIDTHVVGMVLRAATGKRIEQYFADKLWSKLGTESEAIYITDSTGEPMVLGGLNIITRDYARMGKLYRDNGVLNGEQLVPLSWIEDSLNNNEPHLKAERRADNSVKFGYGYQWWIPLDADQEFLAIGIYGQYIYVNKKLDVVIVKNSADTNFMANGYESKVIAVEAFRAIAKSLN
ncbi:beta-lactamase family protein [Psychrosphaera sp. F3M07]|uniref:serine hydrolase domain-containing protein n=1 Tax=Psychrosphaera sp. F3M07 TaxID=2841560 RepID=UPI001C080880|nr:serine hydrolase [Psychrosphaera sp. F3M07]MBU2918541.1 beta-lactamase family protein [Psychrosphaera sp. F3M07]